MRNYNSTGSRDPIWTQVSCDPEDGLRGFSPDRAAQRNVNSTTHRNINAELTFHQPKIEKKGLTIVSASIFIAGEMAGSGVLALPRAIVDSGWIGLILLVVFCFNAGYGGTLLGTCWEILEERYPEHRGRTRNPYTTIAHRAVGRWGSLLVSGCIQFTLFGAGTVYLLLSSQIFQELLSGVFPNLSFCFWFLLIGAVLTPAMWLGSPKEFCAVGIGALMTIVIACVLFFVQIFIDGLEKSEPAPHKVHGFSDFFLSFGTLIFAFGGASTFPTIQNDMENRNKFSKSVIIAFTVILVLYLPISAGGYFVYGEDVTPNVAMSLTRSTLVTVANILMAIHLILAFLIVINPVCQELEEIFKVPHYYHWKRYLLRTLMVLAMLIIGESIPKFGKILSLVGGSTSTLVTFVLPSYFYMRLCDQKNPLWPDRQIPGYIRIYLWELILVGIGGGIAATYSAIMSIFGSGMAKPCYWPS